jgi:HEAT repeat protein
MQVLTKSILSLLVMMLVSTSFAQSDDASNADESEQLKIAALEALMSSPPDRALPLVVKVLAGDHSDEVKIRALFVLSQIDLPEAQTALLETARDGSGELRLEAIRMVGIGGNEEALADLAAIYASGDGDVKESVLHAYLIADDSNSVYEIAASATSDEEFEIAVGILGAMGASEELRKLRDREGVSESLIHAYAMSGDFESLQALAIDASNPERQMQAIQGLGIVGGDEVNAALMEIYRGSDSADVKDAALHGMMVADYDDGVLELFRASQDGGEKRELLRMLVMMDSDAALAIIDETLSGNP